MLPNFVLDAVFKNGDGVAICNGDTFANNNIICLNYGGKGQGPVQVRGYSASGQAIQVKDSINGSVIWRYISDIGNDDNRDNGRGFGGEGQLWLTRLGNLVTGLLHVTWNCNCGVGYSVGY